jgi:uncharacterized repeat protein (TIGR01451 family)
MSRSWWQDLARRWSSSARGRERSVWRRRLPLSLEQLEDRVMLDAGLPPALVVGRTLSSYFVGGIQNQQETITYTVYNESADPLTGVLLTDTLLPGVTFQSASQLPDRSGQKLAWSLGTIQGFDRASVALTVSLPSTIPLQLDSGAQAFATLGARMVSNSTPAAPLRPGIVSDPSLLASTPDANTTDPYIQEEAAKLNYDPQQIFNFLHYDIGYNSYFGSVRGARGTLWSSAGNALDVASLGVALMRASGIPAQYVSGALSQSQAQQLILSMFPANYQTVGYIPAGTQVSDPANDQQLLNETESHYWLQFDAGGGMKDGDPLIAGATVGQTFTTATGTFSEVADSLREKAEVQLTAEVYNQGAAALGIGTGLSDAVVLDQTFDDVDLVGHPLSIGNFVSSSTSGAIFTQTVNTYEPYIALGDEAFPDPSQAEVIHGQSYQDVLTNFPLASQVVTGLFMDVTLSGPQGPAQTYDKTLVDLIGYAARQGGQAVQVSVNPSGPPTINPLQVWSMSVLAGLQDPGAALSVENHLENTYIQLGNQVSASKSTLVAGLLTDVLIGQSEAYLLSILATSDLCTQGLAHESLVRAYFNRPRITMVSAALTTSNSQTTNLSFESDLVRDSIRATAAPGQATSVLAPFQTARGIMENVVETNVFPDASSVNGVQLESRVSTTTVFAAAQAQGITITTITPDELAQLDQLAIDPTSKARIASALLAGKDVIVPSQDVTIGGQATNAWFELNPQTGETVGVGEDGAHQGLAEYAVVNRYLALAIDSPDLAAAYGQIAAQASWAILHSRYYSLYVYEASIEHNFLPTSALPDQIALGELRADADSAIIHVRQITAGRGRLGSAFSSAYSKSLNELYALFVSSLHTAMDPPLAPELYAQPRPFLVPAANALQLGGQAVLPTGAVVGTNSTANMVLSGHVAASWATGANSSFSAHGMNAATAIVTNAAGMTIGSGSVALRATAATSLAISGSVSYQVNGQGSLSFYGPAETSLGVSGNWDSYFATATGIITIKVTTDSLSLNGVLLPAGTYTITTSAATLSGSGASTSPNFTGAASITATGTTVNIGGGTGSISVGGKPRDSTRALTLMGYTGTVSVAAGGGSNTDSATFNGTAANFLQVSGSPATLTTDQNAPVTFKVGVKTSFADNYDLLTLPPPGWTATMDNSGLVTVTPAPGVQGGTYAINISAQSTTNPDLIVQGAVNVTITPTTPGITFSVQPDPLFTVPFNGAELPTALRTIIHNNGPTADNYNLTFANVPTGFTLVDSGTSVSVPAGQTGILGLYLQPNTSQPIPPPGTQLSFMVTATSASNSSITQSQVVTFTVPTIDFVNISSNPPEVSTTPGVGTTATLTLQNAGNVSESVTLAATPAAGETITGLTPQTIPAGQSVTETITLTPAANAAVNTTLAATITATYGPSANPQNASTEVDLLVRSAQTVAISQAAIAAGQANENQLAQVLSELADAVAPLQTSTQDPTILGRIEYLLGNLITLLSGDPAVAANASVLSTLLAKLKAGNIATFLAQLPFPFQSMASIFRAEATQQFTASMTPSAVDLQPGQSKDFTVTLTNTGSDRIDFLRLSIGALPVGLTGGFDHNTFSLDPGATATADLTLSNPLQVSNKVFTLAVTAAASVSRHSVTAVVAIRPSTADVLGVTLSATNIQAGTPESVSAQAFNTANAARNLLAHVDLLDSTGAVVRSLPDQPVTLTPGTSQVPLNLGQIDTTGLANGVYEVKVSLRTTDGSPVPGQSSVAPFLVGLPITASIATSATNLPPGTATVTTTITVSDPPVGSGPVSAPALPSGPKGIGGAGPANSGSQPGPSRPLPPDDKLTWIGGASGSWDVPANWLDTTNNTNHVPDATDAVTISGGATVTANGSDTALSVQVAAGSTLALKGGKLTLGAASEIDGGLTVDSSELDLGGTLTLRGTSQWLNTTGAIFLQLDGNTLTNLGTMTLGVAGSFLDARLDTNASQGSPAGTFVNSGTITQLGTGALSLNAGVELNNAAQGSYVFAGDGSISSRSGHDPVVNAGTIRKAGGTGTSFLFSVVLSNTGGTFQVDSGTVSLATSGGLSTAGTFIVAANATLDLTGGSSAASTLTGTYTGSGAGTVLLHSGVLSIGSGGATFNFPTGMFQWTGGSINLQGHTLTNAGTMTLGRATANTTETLETQDNAGSALPSGVLINTGTIIQQGPGQLNFSDTVTLSNRGSYQLTGDGTLANNSGSQFAIFTNSGTLAKSGGTATSLVTVLLNNTGTTMVQSGTLLDYSYISNTGTLVADGAVLDIGDRAASSNFNGNQLNGGAWIARNGGTLSLPTESTYNGAALTLDGAGSTITGLDNLAVNAGAMTITNGASFSTPGDLDNLGTITLGPAGTLNVGGNYWQESSATLDVQLGGAPGSGQSGFLTATGTMALDGLLRSELVGGYVPAAGDAFIVATANASGGQFAATELPATATTAFTASVNQHIVLAAQAATLTPTTTNVTSSRPGGATYGQAITFTATVQPTGGAGTPTGTVQFQVDGLNAGGPVTVSGGSAILITTLGVGQHSIAAIYLSDNATLADSDNVASPFSEVVNPGTGTTAPSVSLYYTQFGTSGGVSQTQVGYDGTSLTLGTPSAVNASLPGDGLIFLPNGNLLVGSNPVTQIDPTTGAVVGTVSGGGEGDHLALDPIGTKVWTSNQGSSLGGSPGPLVELPLDPFGTAITHRLTGDDTGVTHIAFDLSGNTYYTASNPNGIGRFGEIDLSTFTTKRLVSNLPAAHGLSFDPYTGDLIMVGSDSISQFDPRTLKFVSTRDFPGTSFVLDQGAVDGHGHLYAADNSGHLVFIDYSATGLIGDPRDFVATPFLATNLDDLAPLNDLGSPGTPIRVSHLLPASGYTVDPASVSPSGGLLSVSGVNWRAQIPPGSTAPLTFQLTGQVANLAPGEVRPLSLGTTVTAVIGAPGGSVLPVSIQLPAVTVSANHIIGLTPASQLTDRNAQVAYTVALSNPLTTSATYTLSVDGLTGMTTSLASSVTVGAGQTVAVPLTVNVPAGATPGTDAFDVSAQTDQGATDSVDGQLTVQAQIDLPAPAANLALVPAQATVGQGTSAVYALTLTNPGDSTETYTLSGSFPAGVTATFSQTNVTVPPGAGNFRDVTLTLTASAGTAAGSYAFSVTAASQTTPAAQSTVPGTLKVVAQGAAITLSPTTGAPGSTFRLTIKNTGSVKDTFDLSLGGPAALIAMLALSKVTLDAGASTTVSVSTAGVSFAVPGALQLVAITTSEANPAVQAAATASVQVPATKGLTAQFSPSVQVLRVPGTSSFLLLVNNNGNTEDAYTARITSKQGPIAAQLIGLDGLPAQSIATFRLPGLATGAILLQTSLTAAGSGTITVEVDSLTHPSIKATGNATLSALLPPPPPPPPPPPSPPPGHRRPHLPNGRQT